MSMENLLGSFVWHELMTTDTGAASAFFDKVAGWKTQGWAVDPGYRMFMRENRQVAGLMALPDEARAMGTPPCWMTYIGTLDVDATSRQAVALGGTVHKPASEIPTVGRFAILGDPQGGLFVVFTPSGTNGSSPTEEAFSWHELVTTDIDAAFDFYERLFGWEKTESMDSPMGRYQMIGLWGRTFGGIAQRPAGDASWLPYIVVPDARQAARTLTAMGGKVTHGPMQVPGGGWITQGVDLQGAVFAVHSTTSDAVMPESQAVVAAAPAKPAAPRNAVKKNVAKKAAKKAAKKVAKKRAAKKAAPRKAAPRRKAAKQAPKRKAAARKKSAKSEKPQSRKAKKPVTRVRGKKSVKKAAKRKTVPKKAAPKKPAKRHD